MKMGMNVVFASMMMQVLAFADELSNGHVDLVCAPATTNANYFEPVKVSVINGDQISIKGQVLTRDPGYKPKNPANTGFGQYKGNTNAASGWSDSGTTQILFNGGTLKFSNLGWTDTFICRPVL